MDKNTDALITWIFFDSRPPCRFIKEQLANLNSMARDAISDFIKEKVIMAGITWIIGLLNFASAFVKATNAIYDIVMFFFNRGSQTLALVNAVIDSMVAIARGAIGVASCWVKNALAKGIPVAIGFLASLLGRTIFPNLLGSLLRRRARRSKMQ